MKLPVLLAILGAVHSNCILKRKLLYMLEFIILVLLIVLGLPVKEAKEKWRQEKLKKFENTDDL